MEMVLNNGFCEMSKDETQDIVGGFIVAVVAIGTATYTITGGMVVGAIGTAWALGGAAYEIYNAFF